MHDSFWTTTGETVPAVTTDEMREIDRVAVEDVGLGLLQMMENAGRTLAGHVRELRDEADGGSVAVFAGGGGLCAARHLANRGAAVRVVLDRSPDELDGAAETQLGILREMSVPTVDSGVGSEASAVVDALIGYSLRGSPRGRTAELIEAVNNRDAPVLSLDVPSGYDATTGETRGAAIAPDRTLTLALSKSGLDAVAGDCYLADIGIPPTVYDRVGVEYDSPFDDADSVELTR